MFVGGWKGFPEKQTNKQASVVIYSRKRRRFWTNVMQIKQNEQTTSKGISINTNKNMPHPGWIRSISGDGWHTTPSSAKVRYISASPDLSAWREIEIPLISWSSSELTDSQYGVLGTNSETLKHVFSDISDMEWVMELQIWPIWSASHSAILREASSCSGWE